MNRNESFPAGGITALDIRLAWATLELISDAVEDVQVLISGNEEDVEDLKVALDGGKLTVEQPAYGLTTHITMVRWMQVIVRLPQGWKGAVQAGTVAGPLRCRGLTGSDVALTTVSGDLRGTDLSAIALSMRTVTGSLTLIGAGAESFTARTVSGLVRLERGDFRAVKASATGSRIFLDLDAPFDRLECTTVAGDIEVQAPIQAAVITFRSAAGRLRTGGVSITDEGPDIHVTTVSGSLTVSRKEQ